MSVTSSRHTLDLEVSSGSVRRARSHRSPDSHLHDAFDGRVDRDYFGCKQDASDMKVGAGHSDWSVWGLLTIMCSEWESRNALFESSRWYQP